ncbi:ankyrin [Aspergillus piperis CBS 112811]|uniref:Ankyrin n=1 Tax=Aspergillus piperis CBS 112811 TaxID=1448313 RepID=A0A8G1QZU7_9EURO|nr:ankyrin [Aspergillus piperis CBS 112811]RAH55917.1 ankyrin [Aspergillus piperis CBS 112811]
MSDPKGYTVGWICAISTEFTAAQAFLDEEHQAPDSLSPADNNDYACGRVGKHMVVIAVLPDGEYGVSSAANVARDMLHSFPNIRVGLMVGVGGGAPSPNHDIRLGDIVVSTPRNGNSGVFHYDFGKAIQGPSFQNTGVLNLPPSALRAAVSGLKSQYEIGGHQLGEAIDRVLERNPRLRKKYKRPEPASDRLYRSEFIHPLDKEAGCAVACGDNLSRLIMRHERTADEDNPAIHHGLIASANQLVKDASFRDRFAAERDVLCFEMEAAGLMNHFPCLVIRGICDYADSHKNKDWQGYAALVAAAYARDLLHKLTPKRVENEMRITEVLRGIDATVSRVESSVNVMNSRLDRTEELKVLDWLTPVNYGPRQSHFLRSRQPGTSQWLIESVKYHDWRKGDKKTLLCSGIPGAGKTILTAVVIDDLTAQCTSKHDLGLAYIYCDFLRKKDQNVENLLASILKQLSHFRSPLPTSVKKLYEQHQDRKTRPSLNELVRGLQSVVSSYTKVFVVIDALDECGTADDCQNVFLSQLFEIQKTCPMNILATARPIPEIVKSFRGDNLEIRAHESDVEKYLEGRISMARSELLQKHKEEIKRRITELADGMFLLARLHFESIKTKTTLKQISATLSKISKGPEAYEKAYDDAQYRIHGQNPDASKLAMDVLMWITCSKRQLSSSELQEALGVEPGILFLDKDNVPQVDDMLSVCAGLVEVDKESRFIRLIHHTAQEYFERNKSHWFPSAESHLTIICSTYLSFETFEAGFCVNDEDFERRLQENPLYDYAARNWGHHARAAGRETATIVQGLLQSKTKVSALCQALTVSKRKCYSGYSQGIRQMTTLHLIAFFGINEAASQVLKNQTFWDGRDSDGRTPLSWAAENGHQAIAELLLEKGASVRSRDNYGRTPLSRAAGKGHESIIKLLLERRTSFLREFLIIPEMPKWSTAKLIPSILGHLSTPSLSLPFQSMIAFALAFQACEFWRGRVKMIDLDDDAGRIPLHWAIMNHHTRSVDLLLQRETSIDLCDKESKCAFHFAAEIGNQKLVQQLIQISEMIEAKDYHGRSPLLCAVENLQAEVIHSLVQAGARVNVVNNKHQNPLHLICRSPRHKDRFPLLNYFISQGASTGLCDVNNMTPFLYALENRAEDLAQLLLDTGFDVNFRLHRKSWTKRMENHLVTYKVDESFEKPMRGDDSVGLTALHFTALNGILGMTALLLNRGADPNAIDEYGDTPLHLAIRCQVGGHRYDDPWVTGEYMVETLSDIITDHEEEGNEVWATIDEMREKTVLQLLESRSIDINIANNDGQYPLHVIPFDAARAYHGCIILSALLYRGAQISSLNSERQTCLHLASQAGNVEAVRILLEKGSDITLLDVHNLSPVHYAVCHNRSDVLRLMSEKCHEELSRTCAQDNHLGKSMLHYHAESPMCSIETISILMEFGCDVDRLDSEGNSALSQYLRSFHVLLRHDVFQLLHKHSSPEGIRWTDQKQRNLLHLLMRQWSDDNVHILKVLMGLVDITAQDADGMGIEHHGAIHGAFNKSLTQFLRHRGLLNLHAKDISGKTPLQYAEEEANRARHPDLFGGHRWERSWQNLRNGDENNDWPTCDLSTPTYIVR